MSKKICITPCYVSNENKLWIHHPFLGQRNIINMGLKNKLGVCLDNVHKNSYMGIDTCDNSMIYDKDIKYALTNPIKPFEYLYSYYKLKDVDEVIAYIEQNTKLNIYSKNRLLDYVLYAYILDDNEENNKQIFVKLLNLIKILLDININDITNDKHLYHIFESKIIKKSLAYNIDLLNVFIKYMKN